MKENDSLRLEVLILTSAKLYVVFFPSFDCYMWFLNLSLLFACFAVAVKKNFL